MEIKRYIITQALKTEDNELIPIWDDRIIFEKTEEYGSQITVKGGWRNYFNLVECVYDLKTKKIECGIELDHYPNENQLEFKKGQLVFHEKSHRVLEEAKIVDIVYETYDMDIKRGRKLEKYHVERFKDVQIDGDSLYAIKIWKPFYVLDNGTKVEWTHQLYKRAN